MDIKAAFDTINQDRMLQVVSNLLDVVSTLIQVCARAGLTGQDHDYCLMLYCLLLPPASKASQGSSRRLFKQRALLDGKSPPLLHLDVMWEALIPRWRFDGIR